MANGPLDLNALMRQAALSRFGNQLTSIGAGLMSGGVRGLGPGLAAAAQSGGNSMQDMAGLMQIQRMQQDAQRQQQLAGAFGESGGLSMTDEERAIAQPFLAAGDYEGAAKAVSQHRGRAPTMFERWQDNPELVERYSAATRAPGAEVNVDLSAFANERRTNKAVDVFRDLTEQKSAAAQMVRLLDQIDSDVAAGGAETIGPMGYITRFGDTVKEQTGAAARTLGISLDPKDYEAFSNENLAAQSAATKSSVLRAAFTMAKAQNGSRVTQADVNAALAQMAASSGSVNQMRSALNRSLENTIRDVDTAVTMSRPMFENTGVGAPRLLSEDLDALGMRKPPSAAVGPRAGEGGVPEGVTPEEWSVMSPEDRALFQ